MPGEFPPPSANTGHSAPVGGGVDGRSSPPPPPPYLSPLHQLCQHDDHGTLVLPYHPPEVHQGSVQRALGGYEGFLPAVALEREEHVPMAMVEKCHTPTPPLVQIKTIMLDNVAPQIMHRFGVD